MDDREKKERLVRFLDSHAFDPILRMSANYFSGEMRAQSKMSGEAEKTRFHETYRTAIEGQNYLGDLSSHTSKKKNQELEVLRLPRLPDFKDQFLRLCDELEVK